ncbi:peptidoglycan-binding domain 1 protein [Candidatus Magnetomorum sp. HK-1]|nr:peptidoglycan-binding domain 1 protein [Candidatus Magnetomorum sp. HK-1]
MYTSYFGLKENPFNLTPDPRYLFLSRKHQEALSHLRYGIKERKGFVLITGKIGTGKTTLLRALLADLDRTVKTALIFNAYISDQEILHAILHEFGIQVDSTLTNKQCIDLLNRFFLKCYQKGENAVLFLDEAQNLSPKVLEQIRMLSNLETEKEKLLQIVMVGQSELKEMLHEDGLRQLNERISVRYDLDTLEKKDVRSYVLHRLTVAGAKGMIHFTRWAFRAIYKVSNGNPRLINSICDRALLIAYSRDRFTIDREIILQAALNVKGQRFFYISPQKSFHRFAYAGIFLSFIIFLAFFGGWYSQNQWFTNFVQTTINKSMDVFYNTKNHLPSQESPIKNTQKPLENTMVQLSDFSNGITPAVQKDQSLNEKKEQEKNQNQSVDMPKNFSATSTIEMMTRVTGDIILTQPDKLSITDTTMEPSPLSKQSMSSYIGLSQTQQHEKQLTADISNPKIITDTQEGAKIANAVTSQLSETNQDQKAEKNMQPMEFSTFQPFIQTEDKQSKLFLTMETIVPEDLVQKEKPAKMDSLSFFLGEPWEQGMTAPEIMWVQRTLNDAGYPVKVTGTYSRETVNAVKRLQADFGLDIDGIIGPQSKWALYQLSTTRLKDYYE